MKRIVRLAWLALVATGACSQGDAGAVGPQGATGPAGPTGPGGPEGARGPAGAQGPTGPAGVAGARGAAGAAGPRGAAGPAGPTGVAGPLGATGPQGPAGAAGPAGTAGAAGIGQHKRATFNVQLAAAVNVESQLSSLTFTPPVTGTAVVHSRGFCGFTGNSARYVELGAGTVVGSVFATASPSDTVTLGLPTGFPAQADYVELPFTTQTAIAVTAGTAVTVVLVARRTSTAVFGCAGSFQVDLSGTMP